jgi:hypothetical protein
MTGELKMEQKKHMQRSKGIDIRIFSQFFKSAKPVFGTLSKYITGLTIAFLASCQGYDPGVS